MIPEEAKETIYNAYKDYTLEEFEEETRQKYLDAVEYSLILGNTIINS